MPSTRLAKGSSWRPAQRAGRWAAVVLSVGIALPAAATTPHSPAPQSAHPVPETAPYAPPVLHFSFPDSPEKRLVEQHCVACHDLTRIQNAGGTRSGWNKRLQRMIARGAKLPLQDVPAVAAYLARQFPVRLRPVDTNGAATVTEPGTP